MQKELTKESKMLHTIQFSPDALIPKHKLVDYTYHYLMWPLLPYIYEGDNGVQNEIMSSITYVLVLHE